jgi:hypothetical protein
MRVSYPVFIQHSVVFMVNDALVIGVPSGTTPQPQYAFQVPVDIASRYLNDGDQPSSQRDS